MAEVLKIGKTNYYSVRKGTQIYRVAEGKKLTDPDYCWQLLKDPESGKMFFVNRNGVRKWHLPDIYLTDKERVDEEHELRFRRERKAAEDAKAAQGDDDDGDGGHGGDGDDEEEEAESGYAARDRAAMQLKLNREWEVPESRKVVTKFAKTILSPFYTQGLLDERTFIQTVSTGTREFCAKYTKLGDNERNWFKGELRSMAQGRIEDKKRKEEFEKMNEDLLEKVRRLDQERRNLNLQIETLNKNEEKLKEENFKLRGHKQDVLLHSFKRLTRAGLTQAYWKRWLQHKSIVEAQLHVKAREQRVLRMTTRIEELEDDLDTTKEHNAKLQDRVQKSEGRDVIAMMLKQAGVQTMAKFYSLWKRYAVESRKEREFYEVRQQIANCETCKLHSINNERLRERIDMIARQLTDKAAQSAVIEEEKQRLETIVEEATSMEQQTVTMAAEANAMATKLSQKLEITEQKLKKAEETNRFLKNDMDKLRFETQDFSTKSLAGGWHDQGKSTSHRDDELSRTVDRRQHSLFSPTTKGGGGGSGAVSRNTPATDGVIRSLLTQDEQDALDAKRVEDPTNISSFWEQDTLTKQRKMESIITRRMVPRGADENVSNQTAAQLNPARQGLVEEATERALAPDIRGEYSGVFVDPPQQQQGGSTTLQSTQRQRRTTFNPRVSRRSPSSSSSASSSDADSSSASTVSLSKFDDMDSDEDVPPPPPQPHFGSPNASAIPPAVDDYASPSGDTRSASPRQALHVGSPPGGMDAPPYLRADGPSPPRKNRDDDGSSPPQGGGADDQAPTQEQESAADIADGERCPKCGFRKNLTPFCPRDGSRHLFASYAKGYRDPNSYVNMNFDSSFKTLNSTHQSKKANALLENRPVGAQDIKEMGLPPGRNAARGDVSGATPLATQTQDRNTIAGGGLSAPSAAAAAILNKSNSAYVAKVHEQSKALRSSIDLNPHNFQHASVYDRDGRPVQAAKPYYEEEDHRNVSDYIRQTRITVQKTSAISDMPAPSPLSINSTLFSADSYGSTSSGAGSQTTSAAAGSGATTGQQAQQQQPGKWGQLFDYNDITNGTLGVHAGGSADSVYGVYRDDERPTVPSSRGYIQEQQSRPSIAYQTRR